MYRVYTTHWEVLDYVYPLWIKDTTGSGVVLEWLSSLSGGLSFSNGPIQAHYLIKESKKTDVYKFSWNLELRQYAFYHFLLAGDNRTASSDSSRGEVDCIFGWEQTHNTTI